MVDEGSHLGRYIPRLRVKGVIVACPEGVAGKELNQLAASQIGLNDVPRDWEGTKSRGCRLSLRRRVRHKLCA